MYSVWICEVIHLIFVNPTTDEIIREKKLNKSLRIGSGDPGRFKDAFAFVLTRFLTREKIIQVIGAFGWKDREYPEIERQIAAIHRERALDFFVCERNNTGIHVIESLVKIHQIPVIGITSSNEIKSRKIQQQGRTMDKVEHVGWINSKRQKGQILFPKEKTPGILTLIAQLNTFTRHTTPAGKTTYRAEGQNPDDFAMAFMVNTFFIRRKLMKEGYKKRIIMSKKIDFGDTDIYGTGVPEGAIVTGKTIDYPMGISTNPRKWRIR